MWWDFAYLLSRVRTFFFFSGPSVLIRYVLRETTFGIGFIAKWACSHQVRQRFLGYPDLRVGLIDILHLDASKTLHIR